MWMYLLLAAGLFMGWSLGTNDAANAFGTAVATRVIKYRTSIIIIAVMVMIGAFISGDNNINKLASLSTSNEVTVSDKTLDTSITEELLALVEEKATPEELEAAMAKDREALAAEARLNGASDADIEAAIALDSEGKVHDALYDLALAKTEESQTKLTGLVTRGALYELAVQKTSQTEVDNALGADMNDMKLKSALRAFIVFACAALTVFVMSYLKFPVSANQSIVGAVIGWGLFHANYSDPMILKPNLTELAEFASTWLLCPLGAAIISFILVFFVNKFISSRLIGLHSYDKIIKIGYLAAGAYGAYSIGTNSSASVVAFYYDATERGANLLTDARVAAIVGAAAIALGVLTFSKRVMMTVGSSIAEITQIDGFVVIIAMSLTIQIMGKFMGIPVSTSQAVVGAVVGAGLTRGIKNVQFGVFKNIAIAWVSSPTVAGLLSYLVALATQSYFA